MDEVYGSKEHKTKESSDGKQKEIVTEDMTKWFSLTHHLFRKYKNFGNFFKLAIQNNFIYYWYAQLIEGKKKEPNAPKLRTLVNLIKIFHG